MITLAQKKTNLIYAVIASTVLFWISPALALAQTFDSDNDLQGYAASIIDFINGTLVPLLFAVAFIVFVYGVYRTFIAKGDDDEEGQKKGRQFIMYSIAGFVVIVSVWGVVNLLSGALGFNDQNIESNIPKAPTPGSF